MRIIAKSKQRISETFVVDKDREKVFVKKYAKNYPDKLLKTEFEKSNAIFKLLKNEKHVRTPKPLAVDIKEKTISFEYISGFEEIKSFYFQNNNILGINWSQLEKFLRRIAKVLALIHRKLKLNNSVIFKGIKDDNVVSLLCDLCNSNILLKGDLIYLIDFSPSQYMIPVDTCNIMGSPYFDLVHLIYSFEHPPVFFRPFYRYRFQRFEDFFLKTYFRHVRIKFDKNILEEAKRYYLEHYLPSLKNSVAYSWWKKIIIKELNSLSYRQSHQRKNYGEYYDKALNNRFENFIFKLEKIFIKNLVKKYYNGKTDSSLDFACGTGRITKVIESLSKSSNGLDISSEMLKVAKKNCRKTKFILEDITSEDVFKNEKFDLVTAWRFVLNAEPALREQALRKLRKHVGNYFIFNIHMNKYSLVGFSFLMRRKLGYAGPIHTMSYFEVRKLLKKTGYDVVEVVPLAHIPGRLDFLLLPEKILKPVEIFLAKIKVFGFFAKDLIIVARRSR